MPRLKRNSRVKVLQFHGSREHHLNLIGAEGVVVGYHGAAIAVQLDDNNLNFWPNGVGDHIKQPCTLFVRDELEAR